MEKKEKRTRMVRSDKCCDLRWFSCVKTGEQTNLSLFFALGLLSDVCYESKSSQQNLDSIIRTSESGHRAGPYLLFDSLARSLIPVRISFRKKKEDGAFEKEE